MDPSRGDERTRLDTVAGWYKAGDGFEGRMVRQSAARIARWCRGASCLEVGAAEGHVTSVLASRFERLVVVEPAEDYAAAVRALRLPGVEVVMSLIEEFSSAEHFETIVLSHVLEHVASPGDVLTRCRALLAPDGVLLAVVPNAGSIHRRIGVHLGILPASDALSAADHSIGHRRVYDEQTFRQELQSADMVVHSLVGHFLKPLSNAQLDQLPVDVQEALIAIGDELPPGLASELFAVCGNGTG